VVPGCALVEVPGFPVEVEGFSDLPAVESGLAVGPTAADERTVTLLVTVTALSPALLQAESTRAEHIATPTAASLVRDVHGRRLTKSSRSSTFTSCQRGHDQYSSWAAALRAGETGSAAPCFRKASSHVVLRYRR